MDVNEPDRLSNITLRLLIKVKEQPFIVILLFMYICLFFLRCEYESCSGEVYWIQHYVLMFGIDMRQVGGFLQVHRFPPPIKLIATIYMKYS